MPARHMVVKSDQESALRSIVEDLGRLQVTDGSGRHVVEYSPGASQSNGMIEESDSICVWTGAGVAERLGGKMRSYDSV